MVKRIGASIAFTVVATVLMWSTTFAGLRAALGYFSPGHLVFLRWTLTALVFAGFAAATRMRLPERGDIGRLLLAGLLGFTIYQVALANGQAGVSAATAAFLINLSPVITTVISVALGRESAGRYTWLGLGVAMCGIAVMASARGGFAASAGAAGLVLLAAASFSGYALVTKPLFARYTALEVTTYAIISGAVPFVVFSRGALTALAHTPPAGVATLVYLALVPGGIAYVLWSRANAALTPGVASRFLYLVPVLSLAVAWVWIGEVPVATQVLGGMLALAGVALSTWNPGGAPRRIALSLAASQPNMRRPVPAEEPAA